MSSISFFALGGLDEREKKCFVLGINDQYFIFNMGITIPTFSRLGIKKIVPDFTWIEKNKNKIKGIFISLANFDNVGGMLYANKISNSIPIYTSENGKIIIENFFNKRSMKNVRNYVDYNIKGLKPLEEVNISNVIVTPFQVFSSYPDSLGFILSTKDGSIIMMDDFIIGTDENKSYSNQIYEINKITNNKNLLLISSVGNASKEYGFTSPNHDITSFLETEIDSKSNNRNIITCFDSNLYSIFKVIKYAQEKQMNLAIHNNVFYNLISKFLSNNVIQNKNLFSMPISKVDQMEKGIILVIGNRQKIFDTIDDICKTKDEFINLKKNDKFIFAIPTIAGFESIEANIIDIISSLDIKWSKLPKNILDIKASSEDHKILVDILKPKYLIPTSGLYSEFIEYQNILESSGFDKNKIFILDNGQEIFFENGEFNKSKTNWKEIQEKFVGSSYEFENVNNSLLNERKLMAENGVVFVSILVNRTIKPISVSNFHLSSFGINLDEEKFFDEKNQLEKNIIQNIVEEYAIKQVNSKELKNSIKRMTLKLYEKLLGKTPLVLITIVHK